MLDEERSYLRYKNILDAIHEQTEVLKDIKELMTTRFHPCTVCKYYELDDIDEPCKSCIQKGGWKGFKRRGYSKSPEEYKGEY